MINPLPTLKLRAEDPADLQIISACIQDAIFPSTAMEYAREERRFSLIANRFMWEEEPLDHQDQKLYKRVHSGLHFTHVNQVHQRDLNLCDPTKLHNLLMLHGDKKGEINLLFSDQGEIRLIVDKIYCHFHDLHEPWYTHVMPYHLDLEESS